MSAAVTALTDRTFDEEIQGADRPVLVDFSAEWCPPCKMIAPVLDELAQEHGDRIRVATVDVDQELDVSRRFEVMSLPTLILFHEGEPRLRLVGAMGKGRLLQELQEFL